MDLFIVSGLVNYMQSLLLIPHNFHNFSFNDSAFIKYVTA